MSVRHPTWARVAVRDRATDRLRGLFAGVGGRVTTVCEEACCPNLADCWGRGTATFMVLGDVCTRGCRYCAVAKGRPEPPDPGEPARLAAAAAELGLRYVVVTMVDRDDLDDAGSAHVAAVARALKALPDPPLVEVLTGDFMGRLAAVDEVLDAGVDVFAHNVETVPRLYPRLRPQGDYARALAVLAHAARRRPVKSSLVAGMGEEEGEVLGVLDDLAAAGVSLFTCGQYMRPSPRQAPVARHVEPAEFSRLERAARTRGMAAACGPLVRASYRAESLYLETYNPATSQGAG